MRINAGAYKADSLIYETENPTEVINLGDVRLFKVVPG